MAVPQPDTLAGERSLERGLLTGIAALRWATWVWMAIVLAIDVENSSSVTAASDAKLAHPWAGVALAAAALVVTVVTTVLVRVDPARLSTLPVVATEVGLGAALVFADPWIYQSPHSQPLGSSWVLAGIFSAGVAFAGRGGFVAGLAVGAARFTGLRLWATGEWDGDQWMSAVSSVVLYALAGALAGFAAIKLREAEREIAHARAREEVARQLHDGVLQTLAIVQRRSSDPELSELAREQEHDLREFLFGASAADGLGRGLRDAAHRYERRYGGTAQVVIADDVPTLDDDVVAALRGAVGEALTNAGKHGGARRVTVYVEPQEGRGVFCSVKDDGAGFDPATAPEGIGITRSIRDRISEVGGRVEIEGRPGDGAEVRVWVP
jgi:signal transduction histidine kinase